MQHHVDSAMHWRRVTAREPRRGTLLYVHGLGESGLSFEALAASAKLAGWNHEIPDLPGYGKSPWTPEPLGLSDHVQRLADWLDRRQGEPVVVLGHSMGGVIGLLLCELRPQHVRAFVNVEGNVSLADCTFSSQAAAYSTQEFVARGFHNLLEHVYRDGLDDPALRTYYPSLRLCDPRQYHRNSRELVEISRTETLAPRQARLELPHIYLLGDPRGTGATSRRLLDAAGVSWRAIAEAGHWPFLDQPAAFVHQLQSFLDGL